MKFGNILGNMDVVYMQGETEEKPNVCNYCGNILDNDIEFCNRCGKKVGIKAEVITPELETPKKKNTEDVTKWWITIFLIIIAAIVSIAIVLLDFYY